MNKFAKIALASAATIALAACGSETSDTRDTVRGAGSSTVYPFAKLVAEEFVRDNPDFGSPIIESIGSGAGIAEFCKGIGPSTIDFANASRRMKKSEYDKCAANGVDDIVEIQVGLDGIAFASAEGGITMNLTPEIVYRALAAEPYGEEQTAKLWSDVDPSLPSKPILVYGPPATSGTRDALKELVLEKGCDANADMEAVKEADEDRYDQICTEIRADSAYVSQGEQDNLIVQKITGNPDAVGIFGYSYLEENANRVQGLPMNGVDPTYENISSFDYPGARPLFVYVKKAHLDAIPGLKEYLAEWTKMWSKDGPLAKVGLVASPADVMAKSNAAATEFTSLDPADLK